MRASLWKALAVADLKVEKDPAPRLPGPGGPHRQTPKQHQRYGYWVLAQTPDRFGLIALNGSIIAHD